VEKVSLASTLADAGYYLVWLLFLPQIIDALQMEGLSPVEDMVGQILGFLPSIVQRLATSLLAGIGFDRLPEWLGLGAPRRRPRSPLLLVDGGAVSPRCAGSRTPACPAAARPLC
jgi:hypothetical protein